jgi:hypothetical protein
MKRLRKPEPVNLSEIKVVQCAREGEVYKSRKASTLRWSSGVAKGPSRTMKRVKGSVENALGYDSGVSSKNEGSQERRDV